MLQEPEIERPEHQDDPGVGHHRLPELVPEEQDVHANHDDYHREPRQSTVEAVEPGDLSSVGCCRKDDAVVLQEACWCLAVHVLTAPILPTASGPSTVFAIRPQGKSILNRWPDEPALAVGAPMMTTTRSHLHDQLKLPRTRALGFVKMLQTVPTQLTSSPLVTPPPGDWPANSARPASGSTRARPGTRPRI
jgi:hypothetical protein